RARRRPVNEQVHHVTAKLYLLDNEPGASRQQLLRTHCPPFGWPSKLPGRVGLPEASPAVQGRCQNSLSGRRAAPASRQHGKCARATLTWPWRTLVGLRRATCEASCRRASRTSISASLPTDAARDRELADALLCRCSGCARATVARGFAQMRLVSFGSRSVR